MASISSISEIRFLGNNKQVFKHNNNTSDVIKNSGGYSDYSSENVKASFMPKTSNYSVSFLGDTKTKFDPNKFIEKFSTSELDKEYNDNAIIYLEDLADEDKIKGNFYNKLVDETMITLSGRPNIVMEQESGAHADAFIDNFAENISSGKYKNLGFGPQNTRLFVLDDVHAAAKNCALEELAYFKTLIMNDGLDKLKEENKEVSAKTLTDAFNINLKEMKEKDPNATYFPAELKDVFNGLSADAGEKGIVFIKDSDALSAEFTSLKIADADEYFQKTFPNLSVVTIFKKQAAEANNVVDSPMGPLMVIKENVPQFFKSMVKLNLNSLNTKDTKTFFKKNPIVINAVLDDFVAIPNLKLAPSAIDSLVDTAVKTSYGNLPNGALEFLHNVVAAELIKMKEVSINEQGDSPRILITAKDIENYPKTQTVSSAAAASADKLVPVENVKTRMTDIIGLKQAKSQVQDIMDYIKDPEGFVATGREPLGGAMFVGPPGTGKTELMRAIAGECGVPFFQMNGSDFGSKYINSGANAIKKSYEDIEEYLLKTGQKIAIFAVDEAETLGRRRSGGEQGAEDSKATGAWIAKMDGFASKGSPVKILTLTATNRPEIMDPALTDRPSRLGTHINVDILHMKSDREQLLNLKSKKKPFANATEKAKLFSELAEMTNGLNGDQITKILDNATRAALRTDKKVITKKEIIDGFINTLFGEKSELDYSPAERLTASLHEAGHAEAIVALNHRKLLAISNESRGHAGACTVFVPESKMFESIDYVIDEIAVGYGGGEAEKLMNKTHGTGVGGDFSEITSLAETSIKAGGLGIYTPQRSFYKNDGTEMVELSKQYAREIKKDQEILLETGQKVIKQVLNFSKDFMLNKYLDENKEAILAGQDGKNYLAEEYISMRKQWLDETGKIKAVPVLDKSVEALKEIAQNDKFWNLHAKAKEARNIMSDGVESILGIANATNWHQAKPEQAGTLIKHIEQIVNIANNGSEWTAKNGLKDAEIKLSKTITQIVSSAKGEKKGLVKAFLEKSFRAVR